MPRRARKLGGLAIAVCVAALMFAPGAQATFHLVKVSEVFAGTTDDTGDFIELQMFSSNQNSFGEHAVTIYGANAALLDTVPLADVSSGQNQSTLLIGDPTGIPGGAAPDIADAINLPEGGGAVCFAEASPPDCVAWGAAGNTAPLPGEVGTPAAAITFGSSLTRSIAAGCSTFLEASDDTDNSLADFALASPTPRPNATAPTEVSCGGGGGGGGGGGANDNNPPETTITKGPKGTIEKDTARFAFKSNEAGSTFECKLPGKRFRRCDSPKRLKNLDEGRQKFKVRAIDKAGNVDPTPAKRRFRVDAE